MIQGGVLGPQSHQKPLRFQIGVRHQDGHQDDFALAWLFPPGGGHVFAQGFGQEFGHFLTDLGGGQQAAFGGVG